MVSSGSIQRHLQIHLQNIQDDRPQSRSCNTGKTIGNSLPEKYSSKKQAGGLPDSFQIFGFFSDRSSNPAYAQNNAAANRIPAGYAMEEEILRPSSAIRI